MLYLAHRTVSPAAESSEAHALLAWLYQTTQGTPMPPLCPAPGGKPGLAQGALHCGITHTKCHAFVALSDAPVGLDAEPLCRPVRLSLGRKLLSPAEAADFAAQGGGSQALLRYWTLKEAYLKYTGQGLRQDLRELTFRFFPEGPRLEGSPLRFSQLEACGCLVALCVPGADTLTAGDILELPQTITEERKP